MPFFQGRSQQQQQQQSVSRTTATNNNASPLPSLRAVAAAAAAAAATTTTTSTTAPSITTNISSSTGTSNISNNNLQLVRRPRPRRQRYSTVAVNDDSGHDNENTEEEFEGDNEEEENRDIEENRQRRRVGILQQQRQYEALPTSTTVNRDHSEPVAIQSNTANNNSGNSVSRTILMEVTILDFTHKRWPIIITNSDLVPTTEQQQQQQQQPTVYDLKRIGTTVHNIPIQQQRLIYQGKLLNDDSASLLSLGIQRTGSIVHLFPKPRVVVVDNNNSNTNSNAENNTTTTASTNQSNTTGNPNGDGSDSNNSEGANNSGAHVPVIVMDQSEIDRRSEILVLGHTDYVEAVSNVKLFSLMLLIISTIELLTLIGLYFTPTSTIEQEYNSENSNNPYYNNNNYYGDNNGIPYIQQQDDFFPRDDDNHHGNHYNTSNPTDSPNDSSNRTTTPSIDEIDIILKTWTPIKYMDVMISIMGIYVALLGMRASNENCIKTARMYLIGTSVVAIGWMVYNYIVSYEIDYEIDTHPEEYPQYVMPSSSSSSSSFDSEYNNEKSSSSTNDDNIDYNGGAGNDLKDSPYYQAMNALVLPGIVWGMCIFRAWQFHNVLHDAEIEAQQRTSLSDENTMDYENHHHHQLQQQQETNHSRRHNESNGINNAHHPSDGGNGGDVELSSISTGNMQQRSPQQSISSAIVQQRPVGTMT